MIKVNEEMVLQILSRREEMKRRLLDCQKTLLEMQTSLNKKQYNKILLAKMSWNGDQIHREEEQCETMCMPDEWEEIVKESRNQIQKDLESIEEQIQLIDRIFVCYESLPNLAVKEVLQKVYIEHQKWNTVGVCRSQISKFRKIGCRQIVEWCNSDLTELEIVMMRISDIFHTADEKKTT